MQLYRSLYVVFGVLLAGSPVLSGCISGSVDTSVSLWRYIWVGISLSLPLPLLLARLMGLHHYLGYWSYLESFPGNSKKAIVVIWLIATTSALALSIVSY